MKFLFLSLFLFAVSFAAIAQDQPTPLQAAMKSLSADNKALSQQIDNVAAYDALVVRASDAQDQIYVAMTQTPPSIANLTGPALATALHQYRGMLAKLYSLFLDLEGQLTTRDSVNAKATLTKIGDLKKAGHGAFDP